MRVKRAPPAWNDPNSNGNELDLQQAVTATASADTAAVGRQRWGDDVERRSRSRRDTHVIDTGNSNPFSEDHYKTGFKGHRESTENTTLNNRSFADELVCNQHYRNSLNKGANIVNANYMNSVTLEGKTISLETGVNEVAFADSESTPNDEEERMLCQSDTDDASDSTDLQRARVPRGIVNPNYPGFQHLAHTLQDYSKNIENFYHTENEMTDDDLDGEVIDLSYDTKDEEPNSTDTYLSNNNNEDGICNISKSDTKFLKPDNNTKLTVDYFGKIKTSVDVINIPINEPVDEIPDILKNVNPITTIDNNNYNTLCPEEVKCLDSYIENNFSVTNIIGDFNKEVEDEINSIFINHNNFQDDLKELRKDIETAFKKPIEDTLNHISEVVNQVIKQLVIEQEVSKENKDIGSYNISRDFLKNDNVSENEHIQISKENENNFKKEMKQRPTFLYIEKNINSKVLDAFLSDAKDELQISYKDYDKGSDSIIPSECEKAVSDSARALILPLKEKEPTAGSSKAKTDTPICRDDNSNEISGLPICNPAEEFDHSHAASTENKSPNKGLNKEVLSRGAKEKDIDTSAVQENITSKLYRIRRERRSVGGSSSGARQRDKAQVTRSVQNKDKNDDKLMGSFDVYNIETAMPKLDLDAIESHLKAAKEAERRKRNDREEIRRRLAMGAEAEERTFGPERPGRKPSLHSRLQSGMNLQICFMNETVSDNESQNSDSEKSPSLSGGSLARGSARGPAPAPAPTSSYLFNHPYQTRPLSTSILRNEKSAGGVKSRPSSLSLRPWKSRSSQSLGPVALKEADFQALQATLQTEARIALAQAKETARIQMERERRCRAASPVTVMLRASLEKANAPLAADRRRVSRHLLTDMNVAQLQVIVNSLHGEVELLSEALVRLLMARDELHMGQDSMLVDIEDLTRYLGVKEQGNKSKGVGNKSGVRRLAALVHK